uniref:Tail protein n=1 Tax=Aliivibrio phage vB_Alvi_H905 TaxID=3234039 RepID=A0AB39C9K1_9VIRU
MDEFRGGVMLALGDFLFSINGAQYQQLRTAKKWRWATRSRVNRKPAKQFQGPDSGSKTLNITIHPEKKADLYVFDNMEALADRGEPLRLVGGTPTGGADLGLWVIEAIDHNDQYFTDNGLPLEMKGTLTISEYGEDEY